MKNKITKLNNQIITLKEKLLLLGDMRPGSLSVQKRTKDDQSYGEYWHLSYSFEGKGHTQYIGQRHLQRIKLENKNFLEFKNISDKIIRLSIEISNLKLKAD